MAKISIAEVKRRLAPGTEFVATFIGRYVKHRNDALVTTKRRVVKNTKAMESLVLDGPKAGESIHLQWSSITADERDGSIYLTMTDVNPPDEFLKITIEQKSDHAPPDARMVSVDFAEGADRSVLSAATVKNGSVVVIADQAMTDRIQKSAEAVLAAPRDTTYCHRCDGLRLKNHECRCWMCAAIKAPDGTCTSCKAEVVRTDPARYSFTCPKCGGNKWGTGNAYTEMNTAYCHKQGCGWRGPRQEAGLPFAENLPKPGGGVS